MCQNTNDPPNLAARRVVLSIKVVMSTVVDVATPSKHRGPSMPVQGRILLISALPQSETPQNHQQIISVLP